MIKINDEIDLKRPNLEDVSIIYRYMEEDRDNLIHIFTRIENNTMENEKKRMKQLTKDNFMFYIYYKGEVCGEIGLYDYSEMNKYASIYYYISSRFRNKGIATNTVLFFLRYAFQNYDLNKIQFFINEDNKQGVMLVEKLGIPYIGTLPDNDYVNGRFHNHKLYSILKRDFIQ